MSILSSNALRYNGYSQPVQSGLITWLDANFPSSITADSLNRVSAWNTRTSDASQISVNGIFRLNTDGSQDTLFNNIGTGFNNDVYETEIQSDGKIIAAGIFTSYNGTTSNRIVRLNTDGSLDTSFNTGTGFNNSVTALAIQSDGKILVGGIFTSYNGTTSNRIVRLNTDGSLDTSLDIGTGFNGSVRIFKIQSDGKILVGGSFTTYQGVVANRIIRLNTDGSRDTSFNTGTAFNDFVWGIQTQSDGKILIGGNFTSYNGTALNRIVRLNTDGSLDTSLSIGTGFNNVVYNVQIQSDGKILAGGDFTTYNGTTSNDIIRLNSNGSIDTGFNIGTGFNNGFARKIQIQSDGKIIVGGSFTSYNGTTSNRIVRLNTDGSKDVSLKIATGFNDIVQAILIQSDHRILVAGDFTIAFFTPNSTNYSCGILASQPILLNQNRLGRINTNGFNDKTFVNGSGFAGSLSIINTIAVQSDGKILVGGTFSSYNGTTMNNIARLNTNGTLDTTFSIGTGFNNRVRSITIQSDGKILVGGDFTTYNGTTRNRIIRLNTDGTLDTGFNIGTGFNGRVRSIIILADGLILVGGEFTTYNGTTRNYIAAISSTGSINNAFVGDFNLAVHSIVQQSDGKILVGGVFTTYYGTTRNRIIRLNFPDASIDTGFSIGTGFNNVVDDVVIQSDGKILVGGIFTSYNGTTSNRIIRLNTDGTLDTGFNIGTGFNNNVNKIAVQSDGNILVGGDFTSYDGTTRNYITGINSNGSINNFFIDNVNSNVESIRIQSDNKILVGGTFTSIGNNIIQFDGIDDFLELGGNAAYVGDVQTTFIVVEPDVVVTSGGAKVFFRHAYNTSNTLTGFFNQLALTFHARNAANALIASNLTVGAGTTYQVGKKVLLVGQWKADDTVIQIGNETVVGGTGTGANNAPASHVRSRLGANSNSGLDSPWQGKVYEVLFYTRELTQLEIRQNYNYLAHKWGLTYE